MSAVRPKRERPPADWELVLKRNPVERIKQEKAPLGIREELPALIAAGYEQVAEEDIVRLQWWGLYHDKPKVGTFMLRIKLPGGRVTPAQLRAIGEVSNTYGKGDGELSTRQCVQLHWLELAKLPDVLDTLDAAGLSTAGGCGDTVRNITSCPVEGLSADAVFDASGTVTEAADFFYGNPDYTNLPRKHKYTISACPHGCNTPEINCVALVGVIHEGREGFAVRVGGGLSSVPRISRELGVFVPKEEAVEILRACTDVWSADLNYRVSRVKARLKFMVDDIGADGLRARVEERLRRRLEDHPLPRGAPAPPRPPRRPRRPAATEPPHDHLGVHAQKQDGLVYAGVPVNLGLISGDQMVAVADLAESLGADVRITRLQNFIVANVPEARLDELSAGLERIGFPLDLNPLRGHSIACTGEPHCNFSITETKSRLGKLLDVVEERFGHAAAPLRLNLDGCPHACAQHWVGDLGFQGTTARDEGGAKRQAYDIFVRGGLGPDAAIGRSLFRRVPTEELDEAVVGLIQGWLDDGGGEPVPQWASRKSDDELGALAGLEPARQRVREEVEA